MPLTYNGSSPNRRRALAARLVLLALWGCGSQEGVVGRQYALDAATSSNSFDSDFVSNGDHWTVETSLSRARVTFGMTDANTRDGNVAELVFPGNAMLAAANDVGPDFVTQISTRDRFGFGTLRTRVNFGGCADTEEVVQAVLGYFNDGEDHDNDGITDDIEIDLQVTCGTPHLVYLTVFTDYDDAIHYRKLSHIVDLVTGAEYDSTSDDSDSYVASGTNPSLARPDLATTNTYCELGYEWHRDSVRFFLNDGSTDMNLWKLSDAAHVPQLPVYLMYNLWHPDSHWFPNSVAADFPANDVTMKLDWIHFEASEN